MNRETVLWDALIKLEGKAAKLREQLGDIDWLMVRTHKLILMNQVRSLKEARPEDARVERDHLNAMVGILDAFQEVAVEHAGVARERVYGLAKGDRCTLPASAGKRTEVHRAAAA